MAPVETREILIAPYDLAGVLRIPARPAGLIVFAHGSGSSRFSPRNVMVAETLAERGFASLLCDLLSPDEQDQRSKVFDIALLTRRLASAVVDVRQDRAVGALPVGLFGASTGAAAALATAVILGDQILAVVSRGGRPDLADEVLPRVRAPTLLIVGEADTDVLALNRAAFDRLAGPKALRIVPGATHLFPEPHALETVAALAAEWFELYVAAAGRRREAKRPIHGLH